MIAQLKGKISDKGSDHVIVDVGGVGYQVFLTSSCAARLPENEQLISLYTYTHVREDQLVLFGFTDKAEKSIFLRLLNVSGVGPKLALTLLSGLSPNDLVEAVVKEDLSRLCAVQGIGKKTAERIVVDLKDKFIKEFSGLGLGSLANRPLVSDAISALINLGYARNSIERALSKVEISGETTVQRLVKHALKELLQQKV